MNCEPRKWDEFASPDRHPKWQRVEPGTVIPAGQPYRVEGSPAGTDERAKEYESAHPVTTFNNSYQTFEMEWFVDSSWRPPLELPTEPTWGIAVKRLEDGETYVVFDQWRLSRSHLDTTQAVFIDHHDHSWYPENVADFIPLTDEQVARIEGAR